MDSNEKSQELKRLIEETKIREKKASKRLVLFILIPITFGLVWLFYSIFSIQKIEEQKIIAIDTLTTRIDTLMTSNDTLKINNKDLKEEREDLVKAATTEDREHWAIVAGADDKLESAEWEVRRIKKLGFSNVKIYFRREKYRIIIGPISKTKATNILKEVRQKINSTSLPINLLTWCPQHKQGEKFIQCIE